MEPDPLDSAALQALQQRQKTLLDDIDRLRERGIGHHVDLPQLIVCGDQSSGKSSVLDAISRLRFPTGDGRCTRFATEVVLRRDANSSISISIKPGHSRRAGDVEKLKRFQHEFTDAAKFASLVEEAKDAMGLDDTTNLFTDDVLCVEISGPDRPHLTLVDLPGLVQRTPEDAAKVRGLVESYMRNEKSIILAIVSADYDPDNQSIFSLVEKHDPRGQRTLGVLTKPDKVDAGSTRESEMLRLVQNQDTPLQLGWHVLRNRAFLAQESSYAERDQEEQRFFSRRVWANIEPRLKGVSELRKRLSDVLLSHIERTLPDMVDEIRSKLTDSKQRLDKLGPARATAAQQKSYLSRRSERFDRILREAREGLVADDFFFDDKDVDLSKRLRATIRDLNEQFSKTMSEAGHELQVTNITHDGSSDDSDHTTQDTSYLEGPWSLPGSGLGTISREQLAERLDRRAKEIRGRSLPGFADPALVGELFRDQARPWLHLAELHMRSVWRAVKKLMQLALQYITADDVYRSIFAHLIDDWLKKRDEAMAEMLRLLIQPHKRGHPMTYAPEFLIKKQIASNAAQFQVLRKNLGSGTVRRGETVATFTEEQIERSFGVGQARDTFASSEIISTTEIYYEACIALCGFVDNVAHLVIEHCLIDELTNVFNTSVVEEMDTDMLAKLAAESEETLFERTDLQEKINVLDQGLATCLRHSTYSSPAPADHLEPVTTATRGPRPTVPSSESGDTSAGRSARAHSNTASERRPLSRSGNSDVSFDTASSSSLSTAKASVAAAATERPASAAPSIYSTALSSSSSSMIGTATPDSGSKVARSTSGLFNQPANAQSAPSSSASVGGISGSSSLTVPGKNTPTGGSPFGSRPAEATSAHSHSPNNLPTAASGGGLFGSSGGGHFGNTPQRTTSSGGFAFPVFGNPVGAFGSAASPGRDSSTPASGGLFGSTSAQPTSSAASAFGTTSNGGLFGTSSSAPRDKPGR